MKIQEKISALLTPPKVVRRLASLGELMLLVVWRESVAVAADVIVVVTTITVANAIAIVIVVTTTITNNQRSS